MGLDIVEKALDQVHSNKGLDGMDILWLTGEPLVLGIPYFRQVADLCLAKAPSGMRPNFIVQTNGTLLNEEWCQFFTDYNFVVGVSIDGPAAIHDKQRLSILGKSSFVEVERGINLLVEKGVRGGAICVITKATLELPPDELFEFFQRKGIAWSYLLEASIGDNTRSESALSIADLPRVERYLDRLLDLWAEHPDSYIRDFEQTSRRVFGGARPHPDSDNLGCLDILNVSANGDFYWGNPELMSATLGPLREVRFNLDSDDVWRCRSKPAFKAYQKQIHEGVRKCREVCPYFEGCQGGNPAHKFYEFGSFDITAHTTCMLNDQVIQTLMTRKLTTVS
jgi:uncharacterized protein